MTAKERITDSLRFGIEELQYRAKEASFYLARLRNAQNIDLDDTEYLTGLKRPESPFETPEIEIIIEELTNGVQYGSLHLRAAELALAEINGMINAAKELQAVEADEDE